MITEPMNLGTIQTKLEDDMYSSVLCCFSSYPLSKVKLTRLLIFCADLTIERSLGQDHGASKMDHKVKSMLTPTMCKSDLDRDGAVSVFAEENICSTRHSTLSTTITSGDECTPGIDVRLSPKKALRVAMLKSCFADTILKAKQKTLLDHPMDSPSFFRGCTEEVHNPWTKK